MANSEQYYETFGGKLYLLRQSANLTETHLSTLLNKYIGKLKSDVEEITVTIIRQWEREIGIPNQDQYAALEKLLIDENAGLPEGEKESRRQQLRAAYEVRKSEAAKSESTEDSGFGEMLFELRQTAGLTETVLATKLQRLATDLEPMSHDSVRRIEEGDYALSPALHKAITAFAQDIDPEWESGPMATTHQNQIRTISLSLGKATKEIRNTLLQGLKSLLGAHHHDGILDNLLESIKASHTFVSGTKVKYTKGLLHQLTNSGTNSGFKLDVVTPEVFEKIRDDISGALKKQGKDPDEIEEKFVVPMNDILEHLRKAHSLYSAKQRRI